MTMIDPTDGPDALEVEHLNVSYRVRGVDQLTLRDVGFRIGRHESFGLVGESGCGKSTTALAISRYLPRNGRITSGHISVGGRDLMSMGREELRLLRARSISTVYQEPMRALNPSIRVGRQVAEVFEILDAGKSEALERAEAALKTVQIADPGRVMKTYPHQLSGGTLQRVVIAMAIAVDPILLILDEPTTALDATVEAEVLDLVVDLQKREDVSYVLISHDLGVVRYLSDRIVVLYLGWVMEYGPAESVFAGPHHPYTEALLSAVPTLEASGPERIRLKGDIPSPANPPSGCVFHTRCNRRLSDGTCETVEPSLREIQPGKFVRCHLPVEQLARLESTGNADA